WINEPTPSSTARETRAHNHWPTTTTEGRRVKFFGVVLHRVSQHAGFFDAGQGALRCRETTRGIHAIGKYNYRFPSLQSSQPFGHDQVYGVIKLRGAACMCALNGASPLVSVADEFRLNLRMA